MEHVVEIGRQPARIRVVGDRSFDQLDPRVLRQVLSLCREQVVDDQDSVRLELQQPLTRFDPTNPAPPTTRTLLPAISVTRWTFSSSAFRWV